LLEINPQYPYSQSLASTLLLAVKQQLFFADHLPTLSSMKRGKKMHETLYLFVENMALGTIKNY